MNEAAITKRLEKRRKNKNKKGHKMKKKFQRRLKPERKRDSDSITWFNKDSNTSKTSTVIDKPAL